MTPRPSLKVRAAGNSAARRGAARGARRSGWRVLPTAAAAAALRGCRLLPRRVLHSAPAPPAMALLRRAITYKQQLRRRPPPRTLRTL